jgi:hypothetical protein
MLLKSQFYVNKTCCKDFIVTNEMLSRFNSKMYDNGTVTQAQTSELEDGEAEEVISASIELL